MAGTRLNKATILLAVIALCCCVLFLSGTAEETQADSGLKEEDSSLDMGHAVPEIVEPEASVSSVEEFVGDYSDRSLYYIDPVYSRSSKPLDVYDNTTGKIYKAGDLVEMHLGETRILTVRLPYLAGYPTKIIRISDSGDKSFSSGKVVKTQCDIDPDPQIIDYVNYKYNNRRGHWPGNRKDSPLLQTNHYDWIVTALGTGECKISQTCEYRAIKSNGASNGIPKAMTMLRLVVIDTGSD